MNRLANCLRVPTSEARSSQVYFSSALTAGCIVDSNVGQELDTLDATAKDLGKGSSPWEAGVKG
jgi:hypothetical protein